VEVINRQRKYEVDCDLLRICAEKVLSLVGRREGELSILLVNNRRIREFNKRYRGIDRPTDVLSFPMDKDSGYGPVLLGDIVVSLEKADAQAREYGHPMLTELLMLIVHGILHLFGYDHGKSPEDATVMKRKEMSIMRKLRGFLDEAKEFH